MDFDDCRISIHISYTGSQLSNPNIKPEVLFQFLKVSAIWILGIEINWNNNIIYNIIYFFFQNYISLFKIQSRDRK